jgi:hypothetical protein
MAKRSRSQKSSRTLKKSQKKQRSVSPIKSLYKGLKKLNKSIVKTFNKLFKSK